MSNSNITSNIPNNWNTIRDAFFEGKTRLDHANKYDKFYSHIVWERFCNFLYKSKVTATLVKPTELLIGDYYISGSSFASNEGFILINKVINIKTDADDENTKWIAVSKSNCTYDTIAVIPYKKTVDEKTVIKIESSDDNIEGVILERAKRKFFALKLFYKEVEKTSTTDFTDAQLLCHEHKIYNILEELALVSDYIQNRCKCSSED